MFVRVKGAGKYKYLQIVENQRVQSKIKQRVLVTLGRMDHLIESGRLDSLARSLLRFSDKLKVVEAHREGELKARRVVSIGPGMVFGRIWGELGIDGIIEELLEGRKYQFSLERAIFVTVLHRLFDPGSDRDAERWKEDYWIEGAEGIELHHLYRAMGWIGEELPEAEQYGATPFSPRCMKDRIEERLFERNRDLFSSLDLVFFDTTSLYFEGEGGESIGRRGFSKDHRPDLKQMVVGVVLDGEGRPICCELWPGNTADVKSLIPVIERLKARFHIRGVCVVADRGMISKETLKGLELSGRGTEYILGVRMRKQKEVREEILKGGGGYEKVYSGGDQKKGSSSVLEVKEIFIEGKRYIISHNSKQAKKDAADREAIVESLRGRMKQGDKALIGNKGYRKYLKTSGSSFMIDEEKIKGEASFDGKWVLRTNTKLPAADVALKYKQLWMVEHIFRSVKSILETRPIYHKCDETIRGHVFCSFLALVMMKELQARMETKGFVHEWDEIRRDTQALREVEVEKDSETYYLRTDLRGTCNDIFRSCGIAVPPSVRK
jgi:transposase